MVRRKLAFDHVIKDIHIPLSDWEGNISLQPFPIVLPHLLAHKLISCGYSEQCLGQGSDRYWKLMQEEFGISRPGPPNCPAIGLQLFGDEAQIQGTSYMALRWSSEQSPYWSKAKRSKFLIALVPQNFYAMREQVNMTLQSVLEAVVESINDWTDNGVDGLYAKVATCKGDWKYLVQSLNLKRKPTTNRICFLCMASKDMERPLTDLSPEALWRVDVPTEPWSEEPVLLKLHDSTLSHMAIDLLHVWFLGVGRDLAASVLLLLLRTGQFPGNNVSWINCFFDAASCCFWVDLAYCAQVKERLRAASRQIVQWSRHGLKKLPKHWVLNRFRLSLTSQKFCHLTGKGWHTDVVLRFLETFLQRPDVICDDVVKTTVWSAVNVIDVLFASRRDHGLFMEEQDIQQVRAVGSIFCSSYLQCHQSYIGFCPYYMFNIRPKFHLYVHLLDSTLRRKNPLVGATWLDESWISDIMTIASKTHKKKTFSSTLQRYLAGRTQATLFFFSVFLLSSLQDSKLSWSSCCVGASVG